MTVPEMMLALIGGLGGLSAVIVSVLYFRENKNRKRTETKAIEIESLTATIEALQKDKAALRTEMQKDMSELRDELDTLKRGLRTKDAELLGAERLLNSHRRAIGCRVECDRILCPVEQKLKELEHENNH